MSDYAAEFHRLIRAIDTARPDRVPALLDEVVALAESAGDTAAAEDATRQKLRAASDLGDFATEFAAFRRLAAWHAEGRSHLRDSVLWYYKWIAERLPEFPSVSRDAIGDFFEKMEACFRAEKVGLRPVFGHRMTEAAFAGHAVEADAWRVRWEAEPADKSDDCAACETDAVVAVHLYAGRPKDAVEAATPIFKGEQYCAEVPAVTFSRLLLPLLSTGRGKLAEVCHRVVLRQVRKTPKLLRHVAEHVVYLTLTGRADKADRLVRLMLLRAARTSNGWDRFRVATAVQLWAAAREAAGMTDVRLPRGLSWTQDAVVPVATLAERHRDEASSIAAQFDARNGTEEFSKRLAGVAAMAVVLKRPPEDAGLTR